MTSKLGFKSWHATSCISVPLLPCSRERQTSHTHIIALYQHLSGPRMLCGMPWCLAEHLRLSNIGQHAQHGRAQAASAASSRRADSPIGDEPALMCSIVQPKIAAMLHSTSLPWGGITPTCTAAGCPWWCERRQGEAVGGDAITRLSSSSGS